MARNQHHWWSDIDIFVSWPSWLNIIPKKRLITLANLAQQVEASTNIDNIEVIVIQNTPLHVQYNIFKDGILLYERSKETRIRFIENFMNEYYDYAIWYQNALEVSMSAMMEDR